MGLSTTTTVGASKTVNLVAVTLDNGYHVVATDDGELIEYHWIAEVSELPGCMMCGRTADEAIRDVRDVMDDFITFLKEDGLRVPEPGAHLGRVHWNHITAYTEE